MQKVIIGCWIHDFDIIVLLHCNNNSIIWIYRWTRWATHWQPAHFRRIGRFPLNHTRIDSSGVLTTQTANFGLVSFRPGPGPDATPRNRCQHCSWLLPLCVSPKSLNYPLHQQYVFWLLQASRSVWEDVECKPGCVKLRRVSEPRRTFRLAFRVPGIFDDWYRSTIEVIVISVGTPQSASERFWCTCGHLGTRTTRLGALPSGLGEPATWLGALTTSLGALASSLGAHQITVVQTGKHNIFFRNTAGTAGNHSYYLSFNNFLNSSVHFVFSSMYLCIYLSMYQCIYVSI